MRAVVNVKIGRDLFATAERKYWKHHHPGDIPNQSIRLEPFWPLNDAIRRASITTATSKVRKHAVDFTAAREQLEPYAQKSGLTASDEAEVRMMLGAIALREGRNLDAIQILESGSEVRARGTLGLRVPGPG